MANRMSTFSTTSRTMGATAAHQMSTTTLLNALHQIYSQNQSYSLDASTSLAVSTWLTASDANGGDPAVDSELARRAWEHARRRAEDACILLGSLHQSAPSLLVPFISTLPLSLPPILFTSLSILRAFTSQVTPFNASLARYSSLAVQFTINLAGDLTDASISLSAAGIDTNAGLLKVPAESGYRAFDVFYYLLSSASTPAERDFLGLKSASQYRLLSKTGTYTPPPYLPTADDTAAGEDLRDGLKSIGIKGSAHRNLLSVLAALLRLGDALGFLIDAEELGDICEEVAGLLGLDPDVLAKQCRTEDREYLVRGLYEALVDWIVVQANKAIHAEVHSASPPENGSDGGRGSGRYTPTSDEDTGDTVTITVIDIPGEELGKAASLRNVFDDTTGINAEMKEDGVEIQVAGASVLKEMGAAVSSAHAELGPSNGANRDFERDMDRRQGVLDMVAFESEEGGFLREIVHPGEVVPASPMHGGRFDLTAALGSSRVWFHLCLHPTDDDPAKLASCASTTSAWSAGTVSRQLRAWRLPEWSNRRYRNLDFTADFDLEEFTQRYALLGCKDGRDGAENWVIERGWSNGDVVVGHERVWIRESAWWEAETMLDLKSGGGQVYENEQAFHPGMESGYSAGTPMNGSGFFNPMGAAMMPQESNPFDSHDNLLQTQSMMDGTAGMNRPKSMAPTMARTVNTVIGGDYGLGKKGDTRQDWDHQYDDDLDPENGDGKHIVEEKIEASRRVWIWFVWAMTFLIPSFLLRYVGRMKRPDVRFAWREKLVLFFMIFMANAIVVFWIIELENILCPNLNNAWNSAEVAGHTTTNDMWVSIHGVVYDIANFAKTSHGLSSHPVTQDQMQALAGQNLDPYFPNPLYRGCSDFVTDNSLELIPNSTWTPSDTTAVHTSGHLSPHRGESIHNDDWYSNTFQPAIVKFKRADLVWAPSNVSAQGKDDNRQWFILNDRVYDLTDYFNTISVLRTFDKYQFLPPDVLGLIQANPGQDLTKLWKTSDNFTKAKTCLDNTFFIGKTDFRLGAQCTVDNYLLLAFAVIICAVILIKFLAALRFGSKKMPIPQDKFVICQIPAYTEGEDHLRKGLDSLTALHYDNKRKLLCVICDGMVVGGGNDRPTPKIVLDILGVDPKIDPPALPFRSIGTGSEQLNYGKVYSGLYEFEGNVVPYIVVVKVGKESEQSKGKPGNRGKRDSQILLMSFLNRVHHRSPMNPLELEMFHQVNNIIGVDPELYEYMLMVDADTSVREDALTRLVSACANDAKIAGICGETNLENEGRSWWTMIQVYEYFISHHLSKAFESLFGSVTCLPGCFTMYRLRTVDKGRPLIISDQIISEYSIGNVDTLHKKNLLSLGEDRFLTTLMTKHFPSMSYKFVPDAYAATAAPETWGVLLSQRRRWINSTIHNLFELVWLKDLCGFCFFSMRFVIFIDLFGTIILPSTCVYIGYIIYRVATNSGPLPLISLIMIAAVYGLQALVFILRRKFSMVGWMFIYLLAFPYYSFILPIYSFWKQDDFSWGSTRIVLEEKGNKTVVATSDEGFDPRSIPLQRWDDYAANNSLPGRRGGFADGMEKNGYSDMGGYSDNNNNNNAYEMDEMRSVYSAAYPAGTVLTGMHSGAHQSMMHAPPLSSPETAGRPDLPRSASRLSAFTHYTDHPLGGAAKGGATHAHSRQMSMHELEREQYQDGLGNSPRMSGTGALRQQSQENLIATGLAGERQKSRSPLSRGASRPISAVDLDGRGMGGPDDAAVTEAIRDVLVEVDLDSVTKKQVRQLVEQRLQTELVGERRTFLDRQIDAELANM